MAEAFTPGARPPRSPVQGLATQHAHFVGIGGMGMRALATALSGFGWRISGSDASPEARSELADCGWDVAAGNAPSTWADHADVLVYSSAVADDDPAMCLADQRGIPRLSYASMLGRLLSGRQRLAVAGTHGKSTTTAMAAHLLVAAGLNPTVVVGSTPLDGNRTGGRAGSPDLVLAEACEYRGNFLHLRPSLAVITGIEPDHFDCYPSFGDLVQSFCKFAAHVDSDGLLLVNHHCAVARRACQAASCAVETYGWSPAANWYAVAGQADQGRYSFELRRNGRRVTRVRPRMPGWHNAQNALAASALAISAGAAAVDVRRGLPTFEGLRRRLQYLGECRGVHLWDDYAHHPTEVEMALRTLRELHPRSRISCVFQPHQALRTARLLDAFADSLQLADVVAVADIFRARERPWRPGEVTASDLAERVRKKGTRTIDTHEISEIKRHFKPVCYANDVLATLGAGDIWKFSHAFADRI